VTPARRRKSSIRSVSAKMTMLRVWIVLLFSLWALVAGFVPSQRHLPKHSLHSRGYHGVKIPVFPSVLSADQPATGRVETKKDADFSPSPSVIKDNGLGTFDWERQWYPIAVDEYTDRSRPHKMQLLGNDIVLWHDKTQWRVFDDSCPHRGVPLSKLS
jgi:hypothetical protein